MSRVDLVARLCAEIAALPTPERIAALNEVRSALHAVSPFRDEPVDLVLWVPAASVEANDYNPNKVAPPEMRLLEHSIISDGFTQPIVTHDLVPVDATARTRVVVDGFHRNRVGRECAAVRERLAGHLPVTTVAATRGGLHDRMASTIRHNRARGKHVVSAMSDIVSELAKRNWTDARIGKELGMDADEVLRLKQIGGLAELFADHVFSEAWDVV